ncbi:MAG: hypothetical protein ACR2RB_05870 [Gammaproteobacteria bacterium]
MNEVTAGLCPASELERPVRSAMFRLYSRHYGASSEARFYTDLEDKDYVLRLHKANGALVGFSTLAVYEQDIEEEVVGVIYSGDTIIDPRYWGHQRLAFTWLRFAGQIKVRNPQQSLYWFLIVKGHRTYRYLSAFSRVYYPAPDKPVPPEIQTLMDTLARHRFGGAYDPGTGLVHFPSSRGHLVQTLAEVPVKDRHRAEVRYFLERNPRYVDGDELVCLCELSAENLKPLARRLFSAGMESALDTPQPQALRA